MADDSGVSRMRVWPRRSLRRRCALLIILGLAATSLVLNCAPSKQSTLQRIRKTGVLTIGTDATYPPFESVDAKNGEVVGFDVDLVRAVAKQLGVEARFLVVPFDGIIAGLKTGKYDLVVSAMTITPDRAKAVRFTQPYVVAGQSIAVRADETRIAGASDLVGLKVGCQLGTTGELEAKKIPHGQVTSFDAIGAAFRDLENRNLDAVIADTPTARIFIRDHPTIRLAGAPLTREEFGMAVRPEDVELQQAINSALDQLRASGERGKIEETWGVTGTEGR